MIRVWDIHPFQSPKHTTWAISTDNDVISTVIRTLHPGKITRHTSGISSRPGIPICFLYGKGTCTDRSHFIHDLSLLRSRHLGRFNGNYGFLHLHLQNDRTSAVHDYPIQYTRLVSHEGRHHQMPTYRNILKLKTSIEVSGDNSPL